MTDPFNITASIVGVTVPVLQGTKLLLYDLQRIRDPPNNIQSLKNDVQSTDQALKSLEAVKEEEWDFLGADIANRSKTATSYCGTACEALRTYLQGFTKDGTFRWSDRTNRMESMSEQLRSCKTTIVSVVSIATLYGSIRRAYLTEEIRDSISVRQTEITNVIRITNQQRMDVAKKLEQIGATGKAQTKDENAGDTSNAIRELQEKHDALINSRKLLDELLSKAQEDTVAKAAAAKDEHSRKVVFGSQGSGFQIGISNATISGITFGASEPKKSW